MQPGEPQPSQTCPHLHTVVHTSGSMWFIAGDIDDDLTDHLICTDCGEELSVSPHPQPADELPC